MIVTIHQPNYLPYLGFFEKMHNSDVFILYDTTQYKTDDWQNRNKIRLPSGSIWLTVPVSYSFGDRINQVKIADKKILKKHWKTIKMNYSRAPYFDKYALIFEEIYSRDWSNLADLNVELIRTIANCFGITTKLVRSSEIMNETAKGPQGLLDLCMAMNAKTYVSGSEGKKYLGDKWISAFDEKGIEIIYQQYAHPTYEQAFDGFEPYMCALDLLFNHGANSLNILTNKECF